MTKILKTKYKLITAMAFLCGLQFFLLPFFHYHPETTHSHIEKVGAHQHAAHVHSEVLEAYAHLINAHPSDPKQDKDLHHSHSSADHDRDDSSFYKFQDNALKSFFVIKHIDSRVSFEPDSPAFSSQVKVQIPVFKLPQFQKNHSSRAPPFLLV